MDKTYIMMNISEIIMTDEIPPPPPRCYPKPEVRTEPAKKPRLINVFPATGMDDIVTSDITLESNRINYETEVFEDREQNIITNLYGHWRERNEIAKMENDFSIKVSADIHMSVTTQGDNVRARAVSVMFPKILPRTNMPLIPLTISNSGTKQKDEFNIKDAAEIMNSKSVNIQKFAYNLMGREAYDQSFAYRIGCRFLNNITRNDISDIFLSLFIMEDKLRLIQLLNPQMEVGMAITPADGITLASSVPTNVELQETCDIWNKAISDGRIMLKDENLTDVDKIIIRALTLGPQYWVIPNKEDTVPLNDAIVGDTRPKFFLYGEKVPVLPDPALVTPEQIQTTAIKLAQTLYSIDDYVKGWVRAQCYLNGKMLVQGPRNNSRRIYMTSTLESITVSSPHPKGTNGLWHILDLEKPPPKMNLYWLKEFKTLTKMKTEERSLVGALLASIISVHLSSTLHHFNLTGRELNSWILGTYNSTNPILDKMLRSTETEEAMIFKFTAGSIPKVSNLVLNGSCFDLADWCCGGTNLCGITYTNYWQGEWPKRVPYIVNPFVINWSLTKWYSIWGNCFA